MLFVLYITLFLKKNHLKKKNKKEEFSIEIGHDVWIGDNVIILEKVKIGSGSIIAAGSVVTKSVDPYTIVGGVPAKKIKDRFNDCLKQELLKLEWWNWSDDKIKENKELFFKDLKEYD